MSIRRAAAIIGLLAVSFLAGCGSGNDSANLNKDLPVHLNKKDKDKEK
jgi:hypothetical protein